jgi:uncharacterized protein YkwD
MTTTRLGGWSRQQQDLVDEPETADFFQQNTADLFQQFSYRRKSTRYTSSTCIAERWQSLSIGMDTSHPDFPEKLPRTRHLPKKFTRKSNQSHSNSRLTRCAKYVAQDECIRIKTWHRLCPRNQFNFNDARTTQQHHNPPVDASKLDTA